MGARPMQRLIQDLLRRALADELLFGRLVDGGNVVVDIDENDKVVLHFSDAVQAQSKNTSKSDPSIAGTDQEAELVH